MKKLLISASVAAAFALTGCGGGDDLRAIQESTPSQVPESRIVFDPSNGKLNVPTDLLFALAEQTDDGTLEVPDEIAGQANGGTPDFGNPGAALGALDGWSTQHPFTFSTDHAPGVSLDASSVSGPGAVRVFEGAIGGNLEDPDCAVAPPLSGCKIYEELTFGVDFVTTARGNDVIVVPLKPLKESAQYYVVATTAIKDSTGRSLKPSTTYELVRQNINEKPLATESQLALQGLVNSYEAVIGQQGGVNLNDVIFSYTLTVQSTADILNTVKQLQIGTFAQAVGQGMDPAIAAQFLPVIPMGEGDAPNAMEKLGVLSDEIIAGAVQLGISGLPAEAAALIPLIEATDFSALGTCDGLLGTLSGQMAPVWGPVNDFAAGLAGELFNPQVAPLCAADLKSGSVNLPYYLSTTAPTTDRWRAACTNGLALLTLGSDTIQGLLANGTISTGPYNELCQAASGGQLLDLDLSNLGVNDLRHVTRYSPIPAPMGRNPDGSETIPVQMTVPDADVANLIIATNPQLGLSPVSKPENGWPVVILQHGITSKKEDFLAISGTLSLFGYATVAIDHPLHGERGLEIDGTTVNASNGFGGSPTDYLNLASLLSGRDNLRQSMVDTMGLRLGLNALVDLTGGSVDIDATDVSFIGQSLGSITGIGTVALANQSLGGQLAAFDGMYNIKSAVFSVPGGGIAGFLMESPAFENLVKGSLLAASSTDFQQYLAGFAAQMGIPADQAVPLAYPEFIKLLDDTQLATINSTFAEFVFAAQSIIDAGDPNNYAELLGSNSSVLIHEVVGGGQNDDGSVSPGDLVIPNGTTAYPTFSGTEPLASFIGVESVSSPAASSKAIVRFISGGHSSLLDPSSSARTTAEMQLQAASFIKSGGTQVLVVDTGVVAN